MAPSKSTIALVTTLELLIYGILIIPLFPFCLILLLLQYCFPNKAPGEFIEDAQGNLIPVPEPPKPKRSPSWPSKHWTSLKQSKIMAPIVQRWSRIVITSFLLIYAVFACAVLEKSLVWFVPWLVNHYQNTTYKREHEKLWWNDLFLHLAGFMATCWPMWGCVGIGMSFIYYSRKAFKYNRFQKGMVRKPGGRGYYMPDKEELGGKGKGTGVEKTNDTIAPLERVYIPTTKQSDLDMELRQRAVQRLEATPHGYVGEVLFDAAQAVPEVVQQCEPAKEKFQSSPFTQQGLAAIWGKRWKGGYDGRDVRKQAFQEDVEVENREGRK
jgi:hypothetical protein